MYKMSTEEKQLKTICPTNNTSHQLYYKKISSYKLKKTNHATNQISQKNQISSYKISSMMVINIVIMSTTNEPGILVNPSHPNTPGIFLHAFEKNAGEINENLVQPFPSYSKTTKTRSISEQVNSN